MATATIVVIGSEILAGRQLDTNSNWIAKELSQVGLPVIAIMACPDEQTAIVGALHQARELANLIVVTGGLGPTTDDLTRESLAEFMGVSLVAHESLWQEIRSRFEKRGIPCPDNNRKQALLPLNAEAIPNSVGSAPGILIQTRNEQQEPLLVAAFPGVPKELKQMFTEHLVPMLSREFKLASRISTDFVIFGIPESAVAEKIEALALPSTIQISYLASLRHVRLRLSTTTKNTNLLTSWIARIEKTLGNDSIYSRNSSDSLAHILAQILDSRGETLSVAESCSGGMLSEFITAIPGCSTWYKGGVVAYHNEVKESLLGVTSNTLKQYGAVSSQTAIEMARGVRNRLDTTYGIAITGIAGPDGGSDKKPVGIVFVAIALSNVTYVTDLYFPRSRSEIREFAAWKSLDMLRRATLELPLQPKEFPNIASSNVIVV